MFYSRFFLRFLFSFYKSYFQTIKYRYNNACRNPASLFFSLFTHLNLHVKAAHIIRPFFFRGVWYIGCLSNVSFVYPEENDFLNIYRPEVKYSPRRCTVLPAVVVVAVYCVLYSSDSGSQLWQHYTGVVLVSTRARLNGDERAKLLGRMNGTGMEKGCSIRSRHLNNNNSATGERVEIVMVVVLFFFTSAQAIIVLQKARWWCVNAVVVYII